MQLWNALYLVAGLDLFAVGMLTTQMQGHLRNMGASHIELGVIGSIYSFVQFFSGPVVGRWSDRVGRRQALRTCILASAVGYLLLGQASTLWLYACIRLYLGIVKHTLNTTKSYLAAVRGTVSQTELFGKYNAYCQMAFILCSPVGGHLMELPNGFAWISILTAALFLANAGLSYLLLEPGGSARKPEEMVSSISAGGVSHDKLLINDKLEPAGITNGTDHENDEQQRKTAGKGVSVGGGLQQFVLSFKAVDWHSMWDVFIVRFLLGLSALVHRDCIALVLKDIHELTPRHIGYISSYTAFVGMSSSFLVKWTSRLLGNDDWSLLRNAVVVQCLSLLGMHAFGHMLPLMAFLFLLSSAGSASKAASASLTLARGGGLHNAGMLIGVGASVLSVSRLIAPLANGMLMHCFGPAAPLAACLLFSSIALLVLTLQRGPQKVKVT